jgi:hypothetical protein
MAARALHCRVVEFGRCRLVGVMASPRWDHGGSLIIYRPLQFIIKQGHG